MGAALGVTVATWAGGRTAPRLRDQEGVWPPRQRTWPSPWLLPRVRTHGHQDGPPGFALRGAAAGRRTGAALSPCTAAHSRPPAADLRPVAGSGSRQGRPAPSCTAAAWARPHPERPGAPLMSGREGRAVTAQCARRMSTAPLGPARFLGHQFNESAARLSPQDSSIPCQGEPSSTAHTVSVCLS